MGLLGTIFFLHTLKTLIWMVPAQFFQILVFEYVTSRDPGILATPKDPVYQASICTYWSLVHRIPWGSPGGHMMAYYVLKNQNLKKLSSEHFVKALRCMYNKSEPQNSTTWTLCLVSLFPILSVVHSIWGGHGDPQNGHIIACNSPKNQKKKNLNDRKLRLPPRMRQQQTACKNIEEGSQEVCSTTIFSSPCIRIHVHVQLYVY